MESMIWRVEWISVILGEYEDNLGFSIACIDVLRQGYMICGFCVTSKEDLLVACMCC